MNRSSPISLFSFQDIITSLTGVMILIILVILLQLFEAMDKVLERRKLQPEYLVYQESERKLKDELNSLEEALTQPPWEPMQVANMTLPQLQQKNEELTKIIADTQTSVDSLKQAVTQQELRKQQLRTHLQTLKQNKLKMQQNFLADKQKLTDQINRLKQEQIDLEHDLQQRQNTLSFSFPGMEHLHPILIECTAWGFRLKTYPHGEIKSLGTPGQTTGREMIQDAKRAIACFPPTRFYPVLLFRRESISWFLEIIVTMTKDYQYGKEPLEDQEVCF